MQRNDELERRLVEWVKEYGGSRYEDTGWPGMSPISTLMTYHGPAPQGLNPRSRKDWTPADEVQKAVDLLERQHSGHGPAQCLRMEYMHPRLAFIDKKELLRKIGIDVYAEKYSRWLEVARKHVAAYLHISYDARMIEPA